MPRKSSSAISEVGGHTFPWRWSLARRPSVYFCIVTLLLLAALVMGVAIGSLQIAPGIVARVFASHVLPAGWIDLRGIQDSEQTIIWLVRTPRAIVAACVGASLAVAGAQMQGLFRNSLASPDIIGCSSGGAFGAVIALASGLATRSLFYLPMLSFVGALMALFLVYAIATSRGKTPVTTLLLAGVALNALIGAATSFLITVKWVRIEVSQEILYWLMGGLDSKTWEHVWLVLPCCLLGIFFAIYYSRDLDVLVLGEEAAQTVGLNVEQMKRVMLTVAAFLTGGAVAVSGMVGFVGLIVPHMVRLILGPKHRTLLPASALTGAVLLILADLLARTLQPPMEIRLGIITAIFGAPFFLYLLMRQHRAFGGA